MIESIQLRDFGKHKKVKVEFAPGVTVLVGKSKAGKTTVLRALGLVALNRWSAGYVRHGKKTTTVTLKVDGKKVTRAKGKGKNVYTLNDKTFVAFGNAVPPPVDRLMNVGPDNVQRQLDQAFWLSDSGGQVSKHLNRIINLQAIDQALALAASEVVKAKSTVRLTEDRLTTAKARKRELDWVREAWANCVRLTRAKKAYARQIELNAILSHILSKLDSARRRQETRANAMLDGKKTIAAGDRVAELARNADSLEKLLDQIEKRQASQGTPVPDIAPLLALRAEGDALVEQEYELSELIKKVTTLQDKSWEARTRLKTLKAKIQSTGSLCPACGRPLKTATSNTSPSSASSSATSTSGPRRPSAGRRKEKPGTKSKPGI